MPVMTDENTKQAAAAFMRDIYQVSANDKPPHSPVVSYHTLPVLARSLGFASASCVSTFAYHAWEHAHTEQQQR